VLPAAIGQYEPFAVCGGCSLGCVANNFMVRTSHVCWRHVAWVVLHAS
jgi:hypothetical protein